MKRLAVVGLGNMGRNHVRTINDMSSAQLSYVVDYERTAAQEIARDFGAEASLEINDIQPENTDGVIVASPSTLHFEHGQQLLEKGLHVLMEKPLSLEVEQGERLAKIAKESGRVLMVGHTELFNPAIRELDRIVCDMDIRSMRFKRLGAVKDESRLYHDAVYDLMVHDLAVTLKFLGKTDEQAEVLAAIGRNDTQAAPDPAEAWIRFDTGEDVHLRASRAYTGGKVRTVEIETEENVIDADFIDHVIKVKQAGEGVFKVGERSFAQNVSEATYHPQKIAEPLALELAHFVACMEGDANPESESVSAVDAIRVMRLADKILQKIRDEAS